MCCALKGLGLCGGGYNPRHMALASQHFWVLLSQPIDLEGQTFTIYQREGACDMWILRVQWHRDTQFWIWQEPSL